MSRTRICASDCVSSTWVFPLGSSTAERNVPWLNFPYTATASTAPPATSCVFVCESGSTTKSAYVDGSKFVGSVAGEKLTRNFPFGSGEGERYTPPCEYD